MPTATIKTKMIVLWADEIRLAAQALKRWAELPEDAPEADNIALGNAAVTACHVALQGADDDGAVLLLTTKPTEG